MAVDTRDKRFSMLGIGMGWFKAAPNPDGGFASAGDRQMLAYMYSGITASSPTAEATLSGGSLFGALNSMQRHPRTRLYRKVF